MKSRSSHLDFAAAEIPLDLPRTETTTACLRYSSLLLDAIDYIESDAYAGGDYLAILVDGGCIVTMVVGSDTPIVVERMFTYNQLVELATLTY